MMKWWMVWRYLCSGRKYLNITFILAVTGVALGVTSLILAMAVVSGYETTLRNSVIQLQGHVVVAKRGGMGDDRREILKKIKTMAPEIKDETPFVQIEGLLVHNKKIAGIMLEGLDPESVGRVLQLEKRLSAGRFHLGVDGERSSAIIGKGIAEKFNLKPGDEFKIVVPLTRSAASGFKPKVQVFRVAGVIDLGRTDYDERYVISDLKSVQAFGEIGERIAGWRLRLTDWQEAQSVTSRIGNEIWAQSWFESNANLFRAVKYEKIVIFIIVLLMVVAAAFNVSSTLFLTVVRRYSQIGILKAMGVSQKFIQQLFSAQGLFIGIVGATLGVIFGFLACQIFLWAERVWGLFPGEVYKLDHVELEVRYLDLSLILVCTLVICYLSTRAPARKGARLPPVEGLRYE